MGRGGGNPSFFMALVNNATAAPKVCYNIGVRRPEAATAIKTMPPLTIRKPETLLNRLEKMEAEALATAANTNQKTAVTVRINGAQVQSVVTPAVNPGRFYRLFYVNGKRIAKNFLIDNQVLLGAS